MQRFFLGNNTAYGFVGNYEEELKDKDTVVLLKGGPGTGKSTILKKLAKEAEIRRYSYELWYCSGDPKSLDGVYIKDINAAIVDATAPHATGADLPVVKDIIVDLAASLKRDKLKVYEDDIKNLIKCKKHRFIRAYQHLNTALCHLKNKIALEKEGVAERKIRELALQFLNEIKVKYDLTNIVQKTRKLFSTAICPAGESAYFDFLDGKTVFKICGCEYAMQVFFEEITKHVPCDILTLNPLEPIYIDGLVVGEVAVVKDAGNLEVDERIIVALNEFEHFENEDEILDEKNGVTLEVAFAVQELNRAREFHLEMEKYFVQAMDFENNEMLYEKIKNIVFD